MNDIHKSPVYYAVCIISMVHYVIENTTNMDKDIICNFFIIVMSLSDAIFLLFNKYLMIID